jgi:hypothetical protein
MSTRKPDSFDNDTWLSEEQLAQCAKADEADLYPSPVPTQMVSNGEYMPHPQTEQQKRVEARIKELTETASKKLGVSRRQFLASSGGMAAAFLAMNEVFGRFFEVDPIEMFEPEAFANHGAPRDLFVMDDQLHFVRSTRNAGQTLRAIAQGPSSAPTFTMNPFNPTNQLDELGGTWTPWNPALLNKPLVAANHHFIQFVKDVFLDSQVTVGLLSNVTASIFSAPGEAPRPPKNISESLTAESLTAEQTVAARNFLNKISGSTRLLAHGLLYTGVGNLDYIRYQAENYRPDSWKGYNVSNAAKVDTDPESLMRRWRLDDEDVAYPTYEVVSHYARKYRRSRPGMGTICVHKGLAPDENPSPEIGHPADVPKAAADWPNLNFIIYHSCIRPRFFMFEALQDLRSGALREGVPDIEWTTEFAQLASPFRNVYGEIGTTFASTVITFPTVCAHILGQLLKYLGPHRVVFGSDSVWYGSPQWQIEAFWRFEIPHQMRRRYGYPALTKAVKRRILGLNSARIYGLFPKTKSFGRRVYRPVPHDYASRIPDDLKTLWEFPGYTSDNLERMRTQYAEMNLLPGNIRYGWVRRA